MNLLHKLRNKCLLLITALALIVGASFGLLGLVNSPSSAYASMIKFDKETTVSISNGSFNSFSESSRYPYTVKDYTTIGNKPTSMITGAINISDSVYKDNYEKYGLHEYRNPKGTGTDNYVLMINNAKQEGKENSSNYGYVSKEFTLKSNGYYYVTVSVNTMGTEGVASLYLLQDDQVFENYRIENITTNSAWVNYTFFVSNKSDKDLVLNFAMRMGSIASKTTGCVLFDELHAGAISKETLTNALNTFDSKTYVYNEFYNNTLVKNVEFDTDTEYFTIEGTGYTDDSLNRKDVILTTNDEYVLYKGEEEDLLPNATYKFSINAKISEALKSGSAFVKLTEILPETDDYEDFMEDSTTERTAKTSNLTMSSVTSGTLTDGYVQYSIFVRTDSRDSSKVQFSFGLGNGGNATGSVSFKSFQIERVPYSVYSSASTGSYVAKMDITESLTLSGDEYSNYTFDKMESESYSTVQYPAKPTSWSKIAEDEDKQTSGVINLAEFDAVKAEYDIPANYPAGYIKATNNNVLMIYNNAKSTTSYTSSSKSLSANKWYKITVPVTTQQVSTGASVVAKLTSGDNTISIAKVANIDTNSNWQKVELYIHTATTSCEVSVELVLNDTGVVFFDNITLDSADSKEALIDTIDLDVYTQDYTNKINLSEVDLTNPFITSTSSKDFNAPILFNGESISGGNVNAGIVNLDSETLHNIINKDKIEELTSLAGNRSVIAISSTLNQDVYYQFSNLIAYSFDSISSEKYYKLSFDLFTYDIGQENKETEEKYDNNVLAEGVNISLTGLENATFKYLNTNGKWQNYEFYIGLNEATTSNLTFSLGSEHTGCYGKAFLGNITLTEVGKTTFDSVSTAGNILKVDTIIKTNDDTTNNDKDGPGTNFSWAYIPTILTFVAIVVAVIAIFLRRNVKIKKHVKGGKPEYDRESVMINKFRRIAMDEREKEIRALTKECAELTEARNQYETEYKQSLSKLRATKLANRDGSKRHEIMVVEKEIKNLSKLIARYGVEVNNCESQIEFMKTEAYLVALSKQMYREDVANRSVVRKTQDLTQEEREQLFARRRKKQEAKKLKAELKAEKIASKQEKLQEEYNNIQQQKQQAVEKDEQYAKDKQLKYIQQEQAKLEKQKAKAELKAKKIEEQVELEQNNLNQTKHEDLVENEEVSNETDDSISDVNVEVETEVENETEVTTEAIVDEQESENKEEQNEEINESSATDDVQQSADETTNTTNSSDGE